MKGKYDQKYLEAAIRAYWKDDSGVGCLEGTDKREIPTENSWFVSFAPGDKSCGGIAILANERRSVFAVYAVSEGEPFQVLAALINDIAKFEEKNWIDVTPKRGSTNGQ